MDVHVVTALNARFYATEIEENYRLRHLIFVERMHWEALRRPDGREVDQYDVESATNLLLLRGGHVAGGLRFNALGGPNLLFGKFEHMVTRELPAAKRVGADWTRFYVTERPQALGPSSGAGALYCSAMEHALAQEWEYLTFVSRPAMIEILLSMGWHVTPLGPPQIIDGDLAVAAYITVDEAALFQARVYCGQPSSLLRDRRAGSRVRSDWWSELLTEPLRLN